MPSRMRSWLQDHEPQLWLGWTVALVLGLGIAFVGPALQRTGGWWPAPLDDVYIYFGFARSWTLGHPMSWFPGNGYSSGCTSVLYPLLLAPGYALGLTDSWLGAWAWLIAVACLVDLCRSLRQVLGGGAESWAVAPLMLCLPLLDWSWFSGMETALLGALLGRALAAAHRSGRAPPHRRAMVQLAAGTWLAMLVLTRPETVALALPLGVVVVHQAGALRTWPSLARALGPAALGLLGQSSLNRALTGEWAPAGGVRKLLWSSPFADGATISVEVLKNLVVLVHQAFERTLGARPLSLAIPLLIALAVTHRRHRRLALALVLGSWGSLLLVSFNSTARYQNFRYAAPSLLMALSAAALGLSALTKPKPFGRPRPPAGRLRSLLAAVLCLAALLAPLDQLAHQVDHFARASANIVEQHGAVARKLLERTPRPRRILLGDAGAIPYLTGIPPLDGLGLGGYRGMPFARASVQGVPAVVELLERLPGSERPDILALYPSWWVGLAEVFGRRVDGVRIADNVICAAEEKVIYHADWSSLAPARQQRHGEVDRLDVGDLVSERQHQYRFPAPRGGQLIAATHRLPRVGATALPRYDAGRRIPAGSHESFAVRRTLAEARSTLVLRTDPTTRCTLRVEVRRGAAVVESRTLHIEPGPQGIWQEIALPLEGLAGADRIELYPVQGSWPSYQLWLLRKR